MSMPDLPPPVGSWQHYDFDPNELWPWTTWNRATEGTYLVSAGGTYQAGRAYGANSHTLTVAELPSHNHVGDGTWVCVGSGGAVDGMNAYWGTGNIKLLHDSNRGGGQAHNNMPQSIAVPLWHRTA